MHSVDCVALFGAGICAILRLEYGPWHRPKHRPLEHARKDTGKVSKDPFGNIPKGPLQIFVSIDQQKLHLYSDGMHVADTSVATGVPSLPTPLGVFSVIQKQVFHRSNIYSNAPMPFMQRITWSGVALHEGESIGHRASHGCIRMPHDFAVRLYHLTKLGVPRDRRAAGTQTGRVRRPASVRASRPGAGTGPRRGAGRFGCDAGNFG